MLDLVKAGRPVRQVAADLQMPSQTIYVCLKQDHIDAGPEPGLTSADQAELAPARRRIAQLETELEVTRRAIELVKQAAPQKTLRSHQGDGRPGASHQGVLPGAGRAGVGVPHVAQAPAVTASDPTRLAHRADPTCARRLPRHLLRQARSRR
ncbi:hypothetical protein FXF65_41910 [Actinomadura syzygii]|uniref:Uncharacterized protein n=1 Tax=Actinomadura syzygii TaxID=1427538 RepID=A0A5D0TQF1_9ACTN|nr:hypothetical protein FXF65_41910 [Actinomadura syzygii]